MEAVRSGKMRVIGWAAAISALIMGAVSTASAAPPVAPAADQGEVTLKWLGNAGWEIRFAGSVILIDPWITRKDIPNTQEWRTDEPAVMNVITGADYIFVGHSHTDHMADVPFIAKRFGSKVIGSATTMNLALTAGVDQSQLVTIKGGERLDYGGFSVQVVESLHDQPSRGGTIDKPLGRPIREGDFVEGGSYLYYFTFGSQRILNQSTGNFRMDRLAGLQPDLALMVVYHDSYDLKTALTALNPKWIVVHHWDAWREPYAQGIAGQDGKARRFRTDTRAILPQVGFTIPEYFQPMTLSGGSLRAAGANALPEQSPDVNVSPEGTPEGTDALPAISPDQEMEDQPGTSAEQVGTPQD